MMLSIPYLLAAAGQLKGRQIKRAILLEGRVNAKSSSPAARVAGDQF
jgi:hypothetical protein